MFNLLLDIAWLENAVQETWLSPSDFLLTNKGGGLTRIIKFHGGEYVTKI